ncbi:MAG: phosphatase PAP2 family protein [Planctomycetota bacterium]|nr:phosphatase PAP2 family protein [Planctomycetota bacterium]
MKRIITTALLSCMILASGCSRFHAPDIQPARQRYRLSQSHTLAAAPQTPNKATTRTDVVGDRLTWLAMGQHLADGSAQMETKPPHQSGPVAWRKRHGPAYPADFWRSFGRDAKEFPVTVWDDTKATFTNPFSLVLFGMAGVAGLTLRGANADDKVERHFNRNGSQLNTEFDGIGGLFGSPAFHFPLAGAMYLTSLARGDTKTYEVSKTLLNALTINGLTTMALKLTFNTESPNGDKFGWPSGHTSSSFCLATVMYEEYGPLVGLPLFAFASFVGYERIDARNHDFSDVISGALIGVAIGHAVAKNHKFRLLGMKVIPYADPERGAVGLALTKQW